MIRTPVMPRLHTGKSFRNLILSNRNQIVLTIFRLIWNTMVVRLVPNRLKNGQYNLISVCFNKISKRFPCVRMFCSVIRQKKLTVISLKRDYVWKSAIYVQLGSIHRGYIFIYILYYTSK